MRHHNNDDDSPRGQGDTVLGQTTMTTTATVPDGDDWDSEVEESEADLGLENEDIISRHKIRTSATVRKLRKTVRVKEAQQQEQERILDKIIRESDAVAGFDRFHGRSTTLQEVANTSAGMSGWARFERKAQQHEVLPLVDVSSSVTAAPVDGFQTIGAIGSCRAWSWLRALQQRREVED